MAGVVLDEVHKVYGDTVAVRSVDLQVAPGEFVTLLGPSGCGKTTCLRMVAGFVEPTAGRIMMAGRDVTHVPPHRRDTGMVFQSYALFPHKTVAANVAFGMRVRGVSRSETDERTREALRLVRLEQLAHRYPSELSGGQKQRVALARAVVIRPQVLLLDEPLGALDLKLREELQVEIKRVQSTLGITTMFVTHDQGEALGMSDRVAVMRDGEIVQVGPPVEVYGEPATRWAAQFVGEVNVLSGVARGGGVETELGVFDLRAPASGSVHVAVRPEQLELRADRNGNAEVVAREFRGHDVLYRLRHEGGKTLLVQLPSLELHEVGASVFVAPAPAAVTALVD